MVSTLKSLAIMLYSSFSYSLIAQGIIMTMDLASNLPTLEQCHADLFNVFNDQEVTKAFRTNLEKLHHFYFRHCTERNSAAKIKALISEYQLLIHTLKEIKSGALTAQEAQDSIKQLSADRKMDIVVQNVFKTCELLFWATAAVTAYAFCLGIAIPMIFFNPLLGAALTIGASILMLEASILAFKCIDDYSSFKKVNTQERLELNTLSFFSAQSSTYTVPESVPEEDSQSYATPCYS